MMMINDQWVHAFIAELCRRHPEVIDWPSDEIPDIIELIESKHLQNCDKIKRLKKIESVAIDIKYELSQQRVWAGMDWSYHHLRKERVKACFESLQKVTTADMPDKFEIAERLK